MCVVGRGACGCADVEIVAGSEGGMLPDLPGC